MYYPKDGEAHGSWITLCSNGNAAVLLNGAFEKHHRRPPYRKSRGLALLEIMDHANPLLNFQQYSLQGIEPFTLVLWQHRRLYDCRWDEKEKVCTLLNPEMPHIWSSATLYDAVAQKKREEWFAGFLHTNPQPRQSQIIQFHQTAGEDDGAQEKVFRCSGSVPTVSITSIKITKDECGMKYTATERNTCTLTTLPDTKMST